MPDRNHIAAVLNWQQGAQRANGLALTLPAPPIRGTMHAALHIFRIPNCESSIANHLGGGSRLTIHDFEGRMAKQAVARTVDLEPIDRLEEKIGLLVGMVTQLRAEKAQALDTNARLEAQIEQLRAQLADADQVSTELAALRDERDVIRTRVSEMLQQLEAI